jgi:hypothetical protein
MDWTAIYACTAVVVFFVLCVVVVALVLRALWRVGCKR